MREVNSFMNKKTEIRKLTLKDIGTVVEPWYTTSLTAHDFISADYWKKNKEKMAIHYLPNSETYLALLNDKIVGFIAMVENYLAAIFVNKNNQGKGIGKLLLEFIQNKRTMIQLRVYEKNTKAVDFYKSQGFVIISKNNDEATGEIELFLEWKKGCNDR